jgi:hypothetical protein
VWQSNVGRRGGLERAAHPLRAIAGLLGSSPVVEVYARETAYGFTSGYLSLSASTVSVYSWLALI